MTDQKKSEAIYENVSAKPVKAFFVDMLTRDIDLADAILDLLDNCVDGVLRTIANTTVQEPYKGYWAKIAFDGNRFEIKDNCGGIPWRLHKYAFRMGRADGRDEDADGTVGVYGIGMKRAIFKLGKNCTISTQNGEHRYTLNISPEWLGDDNDWEMPVRESEAVMPEDGTIISIDRLNENIATYFGAGSDAFISSFIEKVETHYAFIIQKGFEVTVNGLDVKPKPIELRFATQEKNAVRPFIYEAEVDGVEVFLAVGFSRHIPSAQEVENALKMKEYSSVFAGWTVVCNDRVVVYCDRTALTGWGEAGVPEYHTQFIAISGLVEFRSDNPLKLPTTTTKRGINASSQLYLQVKNKMREGMKKFTDYTNKWKKREQEAKEHIRAAEAIPITEIRRYVSASDIKFSPVSKKPGGKQYVPSLPQAPAKEDDKKKICFTKRIAEIRTVSAYLYDREDVNPKEVGEECFDRIYKEAL
ncbi:MAG: ATP-binding protein [Nitrospirales bacterium]|nr:ATP-binding protein [Nitrospirales bacterium]